MLLRDALLDGAPLASVAAAEAMRDHALASFPEEAVGFLMNDGTYAPQANIHHEPTLGARVDPEALTAVLSAGTLRAYFHSHPGGPDCPSEQDMRSQMELDLPWIICSCTDSASLPPFAWGDMLEDPSDLVGRPFRHGVTDCYAAIRAWGQRERGVLLPDYPREWEWWLGRGSADKDLYRRYFGDAGFRQIDASEVLPGDVWLAQVRSDVPNHGGVYVGEGLAFHHPSSMLASDPSRLSKREPIARWQRHITHWLRREDWVC